MGDEQQKINDYKNLIKELVLELSEFQLEELLLFLKK